MDGKNRLSWVAILVSMFLVVTQIGVSSLLAQNDKTDAQIKRGKYLVTVGGCNDCHTPKIMTKHGPVPDTTRTLSGHPADAKLPKFDFSLVRKGQWVLMTGDQTAAVGPWGVSYAANLTPHEQTGLGAWTPETFKAAMRTGKHMGKGRPILPPMPWFNYAEMPDKDLEAIFAYLQSLKPVANRVPEPIPPEHFSKK